MKTDNKINVSVVIGGAQKAGTTYLHRALGNALPELCVTNPKEARLFIKDKLFTGPNFRKAVNQRYKFFFPEDIQGKVLLDATPEYTHQAIAVRRLYDYNPSMKWIICIRNPIARCYSQWKMRRRNGREDRGFLVCLQNAVHDLSVASDQEANKPSDSNGLLSRGLYCEQFDRIEGLFGKQNVQYILTANMRQFEMETITHCKQFIFAGTAEPLRSIYKATELSEDALHEDSYSSDGLNNACLDLLKSFYRPEINRLSERFNIDFSHWLSSPMAD